jgi:transposase
MVKRYVVTLTEEERQGLLGLISSGKTSARRLTRARILLKADRHTSDWTGGRISEALDVSIPTIERVRRRFVEEGLEAALSHRKPWRSRSRKLDGHGEAYLVVLACSEPPDGRGCWTLQLLADKIVELGHVDSISYETVRQVLKKKNELKPWLKKRWVIRPEADAEFVCRMEDVLDVYTRPYDPMRPVVCMDETSKQLVMETRRPIPVSPGQARRYDYEYERNGVCNLFMFFEPVRGWRHVEVTDRQTKADWARCMKQLAETHYPEADVIVVVLDNLNTHTPSAFYEVFEPPEAKRLLDCFEFHYTPKHGSWLNMAEIEFSVLSRQCLGRRISGKERAQREVNAWERIRNDKSSKVDWQFTTADARVRLKKLYPSIHP